MIATLSPPAAARFADRTLADLAVSIPGATALFRHEKLDFCCGGAVSLAKAASARGGDLIRLVESLEALAEASQCPMAPEASEDLITLIESRYHDAHRRELPELIRLARRVETVHPEAPSVPKGLADLLEKMASELDSHMLKEEQILFPLMRQGGHPMISNPIRKMMQEHDDHGAHLRALEAVTQDFTPPDEACTTWRALYAGARKFADDLVEHIHTENNKLFPRFAA